MDVLAVAWLGVRRRALRSLLTAASLLIGVVTVVLVQGSGTLVQTATTERALLSAGPATTLGVPIDQPVRGLPDDQQWWTDRVRAATADSGARVAAVDRYSSASFVRAGAALPAMDLLAVGDGFRAIRPVRVQRGTWLGGPTLAPQVVVNVSGWSSLGAGGGVDLSTRDGFGSLRMQVVGVVDDGVSDPTAYVSRASAPAMSRAGLEPVTRSLLVASSRLDGETLTTRLRSIGQFSVRSAEVGEVTRVDQMSQYDDQLATLRRVFLVIAALSLLVGSLGILNIGLATLVERSEELSLRRALGATKGQILAVMMLESQIVAWTAAAGAIVLAHFAVPAYLHQVTTVQVDSAGLPLGAVLLGVTASTAAAVVGGLAPSLRAARVPIASIMR